MKSKQVAALFVCNLIPYFVGIALIPLLPVYVVEELNASEAIAGIYLALAFGMLAIGTMISGWLSDRFQHRKLMIIAAACLALPSGWLMGQVDTILPLLILTMIVWFLGGITMGMVIILTGIYADTTIRGRIFGIVALATGVGQILAGFTAGPIVDRWGYTTLFSVTAMAWIIQIVAGMLLEDKPAVTKNDELPLLKVRKSPIAKELWFLFIAATLVGVTTFSTGFGRPLIMDQLEFDATAITLTVAIGGVASLPVPLLLGWLSDIFGRKRLLIISYLVTFSAAFLLINAFQLWHFWLVAIGFALVDGAMTVGSALITDLVSPKKLSSALARYTSSFWIAGALGYGFTGFFINSFGIQTTFAIVSLLPLISIAFILFIRQTSKR